MCKLTIVHDSSELIQRAAGIIFEGFRQAKQAGGIFNMCLSGGETPKGVYQKMTDPAFLSERSTGLLNLFWGDERCVQPDNKNSNFHMAYETLISRFPPGVISYYRLEGELEPFLAARRYEKILRYHFPDPTQPTFDLLLLGLGSDGHTASLFPNTAAVVEKDRWVLGHFVSQISSWRLTLTAPIFNRAKKIIFLVSGGAKANVLSQVLTGPYTPQKYPAQLIQPVMGDMIWLVDREAASMLPDGFTG